MSTGIPDFRPGNNSSHNLARSRPWVLRKCCLLWTKLSRCSTNIYCLPQPISNLYWQSFKVPKCDDCFGSFYVLEIGLRLQYKLFTICSSIRFIYLFICLRAQISSSAVATTLYIIYKIWENSFHLVRYLIMIYAVLLFPNSFAYCISNR